MSTITRFSGWTITPPIAPGTPTAPVTLAIDGQTLTQWIGDPPLVWQTPLEQVRDLALSVGPRLRLAGTINGIRYHWSTRREDDHHLFVDAVRAAGGRVVVARRAWVGFVVALVAVVVLASVASIALFVDQRVSPAPSAAALRALTISRGDLPAGWSADGNGLLTVLVGTAGTTTTNATTPPPPTGVAAKIWSTASANFQRCVGVSAGADRMFGAAGQQPELQVSGTVYADTALAGTEVGSVVQEYGAASMVNADLAEYSRAAFGRCWGQVSAQLLASAVTDTVAAAKQGYLTTTYLPATFVKCFHRGGLTTLTVPSVVSNATLVSIFAARGRYEVAFYALSEDWAKAKPTVLAAFESELARLAATNAATPPTYAAGSLVSALSASSGSALASAASAR